MSISISAIVGLPSLTLGGSGTVSLDKIGNLSNMLAATSFAAVAFLYYVEKGCK